MNLLAVVDWSPLVAALAALLVAATPVLVALLWVRVHEAERRLSAGQQSIAEKVSQLEARRAGAVRTRQADGVPGPGADRREGGG